MRIFGRYFGTGIVLMLTGFLGAGCLGTTQQIIKPEYRERVQGRTTVGVLPLGYDLLPDSVLAQLPPLSLRGRDLFYRDFGPTLAELASITVIEAGQDYQPEANTFAYRRLELSEDDTITVPVPLAGTLRLDNRIPSFLLLIDDLKIIYGTDEGREALGALVTEQLVMTATCEYVLWDNHKDRMVGYGRVRATMPTEAGANVRAPITVLFRRLGTSIIRKSPFVPTVRGVSD